MDESDGENGDDLLPSSTKLFDGLSKSEQDEVAKQAKKINELSSEDRFLNIRTLLSFIVWRFKKADQNAKAPINRYVA